MIDQFLWDATKDFVVSEPIRVVKVDPNIAALFPTSRNSFPGKNSFDLIEDYYMDCSVRHLKTGEEE